MPLEREERRSEITHKNAGCERHGRAEQDERDERAHPAVEEVLGRPTREELLPKPESMRLREAGRRRAERTYRGRSDREKGFGERADDAVHPGQELPLQGADVDAVEGAVVADCARATRSSSSGQLAARSSTRGPSGIRTHRRWYRSRRR